jgi:hypothetical protein
LETHVFLVSAPDSRLLVRSPGEDNHETTLVVPDLPAVSLPYERCLVDEGASFVEHAVVRLGVLELGQNERSIVETALSAARPTIVSFLSTPDGAQASAETAQGVPAPGPGAEACAVCLIDADNKYESQDALGCRIVQQRRFFVCEPLG